MRILQKILRYVLPLLFGIGIVWFLSSRLDIGAVSAVLHRGISWSWVAVSLLLALISHIIRGLRWRLQIQTFDVNPTTHDMAVAVFGNYGLNLVIPRIGEFWRCNYIADRYGNGTKLSFTTAVGTMVSERVVDMVMAASMLVVAFAIDSHVFVDFFRDRAAIDTSAAAAILTSWWLWSGLTLVAIVLFAVRRHLRENRLFRWLGGVTRNVIDGFWSLRLLQRPWLYVAYSVLLWITYYLSTYAQLYFFDFTSGLGPTAALSVFVIGSLSLLVPVQGGLGAWHVAVIFTLGCYGIPEAEAFSFTLVSWAIEQGFVLLLGLYALVVVMLQRNGRATLQ